MTFDALFNAFATFFILIDPPGQIAIFLALTVGFSSSERRQIALRASVIGIIIILVFMTIGQVLLDVLGISIAAFRVAGGLLLFYTAFEMVFEKRAERKNKTVKRAISKQELHSIAVFPLAIPLIAGPGAISAAILLATEFPWGGGRSFLMGALVAVGLITYLALRLADRMDKWLGDTGRVVVTRLFGIILAALSVQFVAEGIMSLAAG